MVFYMFAACLGLGAVIKPHYDRVDYVIGIGSMVLLIIIELRIKPQIGRGR